MRRLLPTIVVLSLGLSALLWGLASLQRIFVEERNEAQARVEAERGALQEYARRTLEQLLENHLHEAEADISAALENPLVGTSELLLVADARQRFPRPITYAPGSDRPAHSLYVAVKSGLEIPVADPSSPWAERLRLLEAVREAVRKGGRGNIERTVRGLLRHRARYVIDSKLDIPSMLAALDQLSARANPQLLSALLRDGVREGSTTLIEGLQPALLRRRERFTYGDFRFLAARVLALSDLAGVEAQDFRERIDESPTPPFAVPRALVLPSLLQHGSWYARSDGAGRIIGTAVDSGALVAEIDAQMRERALIEAEDFLELPELGETSAPVATLPITVTAPRFVDRIADAQENYRIKSLFLVGSIGLALVIVALSVVLASRKQRFVELKNDFVATVSHELRTPLASLRLMAETVERRTAGFAAARDYPTRMVREIDELAFLVENILSFNRLDKGRWRPRRESIDLHALVEHVGTDLAPFTNKPLRVRTRGLEGIVVRGDPELLRLLFHNLGKNACAYCERDEVEIEVAVVHATGWLRRGTTVLLRDNGVGIPRREHRRIFGDFYRGHRSPGSRGSGLGLAICRKTMAAHGGRIRIAASSAAGTTFALDFPPSVVGGS